MSEPQGSATGQVVDLGQEILAELEATRQAYHALLNGLTDEDWQRPSGNEAWTIGQLMYHMTVVPRMLPTDVRLIRRAPRVSAFLFNGLNVLVTRWGVRKWNRLPVGGAYDEAHAAALAVLDTVQDDEWAKGVEYPDWDPMLSGFVTIERLFCYLTLHFEVHAGQVRQGLGLDPPAV